MLKTMELIYSALCLLISITQARQGKRCSVGLPLQNVGQLVVCCAVNASLMFVSPVPSMKPGTQYVSVNVFSELTACNHSRTIFVFFSQCPFYRWETRAQGHRAGGSWAGVHPGSYVPCCGTWFLFSISGLISGGIQESSHWLGREVQGLKRKK